MEIVLDNCQVAVGNNPANPNVKILQFVTEQGIRVTVPMSAEAARAIGAQLSSGVIVATVPLPNNGRSN